MLRKIALAIGFIVCVAAIVASAVYLINQKNEPEIDSNIEEEVLRLLPEDKENYGDMSLNDLVDSVDEFNEGEPVTLEAALPVLMRAGYKKTPEGYVGRDNDQGVKSERIITAKGNRLKAELSYDYGAENKNMREFFKKDEDYAVSIMLSSILLVVADAANTEDGYMDYNITVGGQKVKSGTMTVDQAMGYMYYAPEE